MTAGDDGTLYFDGEKQAGGGHPGHLEGGLEMVWVLVSQLVLLKRQDEAMRRIRRSFCTCTRDREGS